MDIKKTVGLRINAALARRGMRQKDLAKVLGVTDNTISYYCSGSRGPHLEQLPKIAEALDTTADYLLGITDDPNIKKSAVDDLGLSPSAIDWLRDVKRSSEPDEVGHIYRAGLIQNLNALMENVNFQGLVQTLCDLIDGVEAENAFSSLQYSPDLSKETLEIAASGQYNDTVMDLLRAQHALDGNNPDIQLPGRLMFGVNITDILIYEVNRSTAYLVDSLRERGNG